MCGVCMGRLHWGRLSLRWLFNGFFRLNLLSEARERAWRESKQRNPSRWTCLTLACSERRDWLIL
jgi:hypothetical protein